MDKIKSCSACSLELDKDNYKKDRTISEDFHNGKEAKNSKNTY